MTKFWEVPFCMKWSFHISNELYVFDKIQNFEEPMYLTCRRSIKSRYKIYLLFPSYQGIQGVKLGSVQPHDLKLKFKNLIFLVFFFS